MIINFTNANSTLNTRRVQDSGDSIADGIASAISDAVNQFVGGATYDFNEFTRIASEFIDDGLYLAVSGRTFIMDGNIPKEVAVKADFDENENGEKVAELSFDIG